MTRHRNPTSCLSSGWIFSPIHRRWTDIFVLAVFLYILFLLPGIFFFEIAPSATAMIVNHCCRIASDSHLSPHRYHTEFRKQNHTCTPSGTLVAQRDVSHLMSHYFNDKHTAVRRWASYDPVDRVLSQYPLHSGSQMSYPCPQIIVDRFWRCHNI